MDQDKPRSKPKVSTVKKNQSGGTASAQKEQAHAFNGLDQETLAKKLIETVEMVKELHQGNKILRDNVQTVSEEKNTSQNENFVLQNENRDLRDKMEILENVIGA